MRLASKEGFLLLFLKWAPDVFKPSPVQECTVWCSHFRGLGLGLRAGVRSL